MQEKLQNFNITGSVVVLNDFFLDRIIRINDPSKLYNQILSKSKLGGSIRGIPQIDLKGGNGTNVAFALARLGCPISLITIADSVGASILKQTFSVFDSASLFIIDGTPGRTTSFEFNNHDDIVNVMISDLGDNENFGPERLGINELEALKKADAVIVTNWASNKKGTDLSQFVFSNSNSALHFLDPADIETRSVDFRDTLLELKNYLDSLCLNENECNVLLKQFDLDIISNVDKTKNLMLELSSRLSVSIDLHTSIGSFWSDGHEVEFAKSYPVEPKFVTGAGDVWDAANLIGYLAHLKPSERLKFANGAARLYVGNSNGIPPKMNEVLAFIASNKD